MVKLSLVHFDTLSVEATARKAPNGDLIVLCTCGGPCEPHPDNRVYLFRSIDGGLTWSKKEMIHEEDGYAHYQTCTEVINDKIYVFISRHAGYFADWKNYMLVSDDSGFTWKKEEIPFIPEYGFIRSKTVLSNGKLLFPYHRYPVSPEQEAEYLTVNGKIFECEIPYIDNGFVIGDFENGFEKITAYHQPKEEIPTWANGTITWNWTENTIVEAEEGHLIMMFRVDTSGWIFRTDSYDFGKTWCKPFQTDIPNPGNKPQLIKAKDGRILLLNTPNNKPAFYLRKRFPLEVWISYDNCKTWGKKIRISDFPGAYSYADGFMDDDGRLKLAFEFNRHDVYFADVDLED